MSSSSDSDQSEVDEEPANSISPIQNPAAPLSIAVENSSDIKVGPHLQYNGPVTIKQYITVHSVENLDEISNAGPLQSAAAFYRNAYPDKMGFMQPDILSGNKSTNKAQDQGNENQIPEKPFSWEWMTSHFTRFQLTSATLVLSLLIIVIIAVLIIYFGPDNSLKLELIGSSGSIIVPPNSDAQWEVQSRTSHPLSFEWTNPKGKKLTLTQPKKYKLWSNGQKTVVRLYDVTREDEGIYILRAYNVTAKFEQHIKVNLTIDETGTPTHGKVVPCYVAMWAVARQGKGNFGITSIDPTLCTHLIYAFAKLNEKDNTIQSRAPRDDLQENGGKGMYNKMTALKKTHSKLKVMLSIGGWEERAIKFSKMARDPAARKNFTTSVSEFLRKYNFDGLDVHWQYPVLSWRNDNEVQPEDCENLVILLKELRDEMDKYGLLLTMPLGMTTDILEESYDILGISKHVDYLFAMCYAYHTHFEDITGPNAPLFPLNQDDDRNVQSGISFLLRKGAPAEKLVLGIALYGRLFLIADGYDGEIGFGIPAKKGISERSFYVGEEGFMAYYEVCETLKSWSSTWTIVQDDATKTPYAYNKAEHKFVSYDDPESIALKVKYAMETELAGIMVWSIDTDDFRGTCSHVGVTTFPLMRAVNKAILEAVREKEEGEIDSNSNWSNKTSTSLQKAELGNSSLTILAN